MARRNFKRQTASLREFLQTGVLGPISFDLALLDIAALLGPPDWWITDARDSPFPLDWGYSDLGISFSPEPSRPRKFRDATCSSFPSVWSARRRR